MVLLPAGRVTVLLDLYLFTRLSKTESWYHGPTFSWKRYLHGYRLTAKFHLNDILEQNMKALLQSNLKTNIISTTLQVTPMLS